MDMSRACRFGIAAAFSGLSAFAYGTTPAVADFSGGTPAGWWVEGGEYLSPDYGAAVDRISLSYSFDSVSGAATLFASNQVESQIATFTAASSAAAFDFPETTAFRSFRISATGGFALSSFSADVSASSLDTPAGVAISNNTTGTSFDASWNAVAGATGYRVYVWTNVVAGASEGTVVWQETMPGATNAAVSTRMGDAKFNACFDNSGWTRSDRAGYPTGEDGTIRIGTKEDPGWMQTPSIDIANGELSLRFCAKAVASNTKSMEIAVERISGDAESIAGTVRLTTEMQEFTIVLPEWASGDSIRFNSITNVDRRTIFGAVTIVSGCSEGSVAPSYIVGGRDVGGATSCSLENLPSVPVFFAVEAYGRREVSSAKTDAVAVDLSNPDKVSVLNACPISSLEGGVYSQNFDSLASAGTTWLNGTTLPYWQAYRDGEVVESISFYKGGNATGVGFFALSSDEANSTRALGARLKLSTFVEWGIAFTNDTNHAVCLDDVAYRAEQWGFANNKERHFLSLACLVTNKLDWIASYAAGNWINCASTETPYLNGDQHGTPETVAVSVSPSIAIQPGEMIFLKWRFDPPTAGGSALMAIDDLTVAFSKAPSAKLGFSLRIVNNSSRP